MGMPFDPNTALHLAPNPAFDTRSLISVTEELRKRAMRREGVSAMEKKSNAVS